MHDGSIETLRDVVIHYNNGGVTKEGDPVNPYLSGGIRPLSLMEPQIDDLVAFMEALTSRRFEGQGTNASLVADRPAPQTAMAATKGEKP